MNSSDLELLVSEVVSNVVLHARTPFVLTVLESPETVRVEVDDSNPTMPVHKDLGSEAITGRGLRIVNALASRWGAKPSPAGKTVWFEIDREMEPTP